MLNLLVTALLIKFWFQDIALRNANRGLGIRDPTAKPYSPA